MKNKIMKLKLNIKITKLQKHMEKQEKQVQMILNTLDLMEHKDKEVINK